jgi:MFS family permease
VVAFLWLITCLNFVGRLLLTTMHDPVVASIPMSEAQFGLLTSVFLWIYGLANPFGGFLGDRWGRSRVIVGCTLLGSLAIWLSAYATTFPQMLTMRAVLGLSQACEVPAAVAMVADYHPGPTRSLANGLLLTGGIFGAALGGFGGWLSAHYSWSFALVAASVIGLACGGLAALILRDAPERLAEVKGGAGGPTFGAALAHLFRGYSFALLLICCGVLGAVQWLVVGWMPIYLREHFHLGLAAAGISATAYVNAACAVSLVICGLWSDRWSRSNPRGRMGVAVIGLCVAMPGFLLGGTTGVFALAIAGLVSWGIANGAFSSNMMPILCLISDRRYRATGYGLITSAICLSGGFLIYAAGVLRDGRVDLGLVFAWSTSALVLSVVLLCLLRPPAGAGD